jgi:hypothetical protein
MSNTSPPYMALSGFISLALIPVATILKGRPQAFVIAVVMIAGGYAAISRAWVAWQTGTILVNGLTWHASKDDQPITFLLSYIGTLLVGIVAFLGGLFLLGVVITALVGIR